MHRSGWTVRYLDVVFFQPTNLTLVGITHVDQIQIRSEQAEIVEALERTFAKPLLDRFVLALDCGRVRMDPNAITVGKCLDRTTQVIADIEDVSEAEPAADTPIRSSVPKPHRAFTLAKIRLKILE